MQRFDQKFCARINESWIGMDPNEFMRFLRVKCHKIMTSEQMEEQLTVSTPLRVKFGIDPTATDVHLGHVVPIMVLRQFVKTGHRADLVIGDFTARIGDPTARETSRAALDSVQIERNMVAYASQIGRYIDIQTVHIHHNTQWLASMPLSEIFSIFQQINLAEAMQREDFRARMRNAQAVSLAEVCYGVLMGIDSVHLKSHVEVGGIDQLLNFQQCRKVMRQTAMDEEVVLMTPILEGTSGDGKKMSKSHGNYIAVTSTHEEKFGKIMSLPDRLIGQYFRSFADVHELELEELDTFIREKPLEAKKQLGTILIALETRCIEDGLIAREMFERKFSQREIQVEDCMPLFATIDDRLFDVLMKSGQFKSSSELRRLFDQHAIRSLDQNEVGDERILEKEAVITSSRWIVRVGKRRHFEIVVKE